MRFPFHALAGEAKNIPSRPPSPVYSLSPVILSFPGRKLDLQLRVTFPATGDGPLPIALLSHGHGPSYHLSSLEGYAPLAEFLAAHGFAVLQPTHLSSRSLNLAMDGSNIREYFLELRARDMSWVLDSLDVIEASVPVLLRRRLDRNKVAVLGHSLGGLTASALLGAINTDPRDGTKTVLVDNRIKAGVIIGGTERGGDALSEGGRARLPFYGIDFSQMLAPALVVWGDGDGSEHLTVQEPAWHTDPYTLAPGPKTSLMIKGAQHGFGGISGWDADETEDESPERLETVLRMVVGYLQSQLHDGDDAFERACVALNGLEQLGTVEQK